MVFFDLNVPFLEREAAAPAAAVAQDNAAARAARLKVVVKAMELGYTGVAYNRTVRGVVADSDRCKILPFPLSSLLKVAPALASSAKFHRELLGVPLAAPFRQYTRLTVAVDSPLASAGLNAGNPVLRTYDLVAVRPLNQTAFDQACKVSQVDLIAIDFSQKLPFRLKHPMVKAAIERGVFFEITYSHLISNVHIRRQMLPGAKVLVDWTRGKNLIFSSDASTVNELRGPYDIANLTTLLGLSMEKAKAAISHNGRSLIANALRKKQYYKGAIRVEKLSADKQLDPKQAWVVEWSNWDPISSGEGDLPALDDIAKFFTASGRTSKNYSSIDFASVADGIPLKDMTSKHGENLALLDNGASFFSAIKEPGLPVATNTIPQHDRVSEVLAEYETSFSVAPSEHQISDSEGDMVPLSDAGRFFFHAEVSEPPLTQKEGSNISIGLDAVSIAAGKISYDTPSKECNPSSECRLMFPDDSLKLFTVAEDVGPSRDLKSSYGPDAVSVVVRSPIDGTSLVDGFSCVGDDIASSVCTGDLKSSDGPDAVSVAVRAPVDGTSLVDGISCVGDDQLPCNDIKMTITDSMEIDYSLISNKNVEGIDGLNIDSAACDVPMAQVLRRTEDMVEKDPIRCPYDIPLREDFAKAELTEQGDGKMPLADEILLEKEYDIMRVHDQGDKISVINSSLLEEFGNNEQENERCAAANKIQPQIHKPGKVRFKRKLPHRPPSFPLNGVLKPLLFVKKVRR